MFVSTFKMVFRFSFYLDKKQKTKKKVERKIERNFSIPRGPINDSASQSGSQLVSESVSCIRFIFVQILHQFTQ